MIPWWGTTLIGLGAGIIGGALGGWLREKILHHQRRKWDKSLMRTEAPFNLESDADYVVDTWDGKRGPTSAGEQAERSNAIQNFDATVEKYRPVLPKDVWKELRGCVRDMVTGADRGRPIEVRTAAEKALQIIAELEL